MATILSFNDPHSPLNSPWQKFQRFGRKRTLSLAVFSFSILMLPILLIAAQTKQNTQQHASSTQVVFVDANNAEITQTTSPSVRVKLTSPWAVAMAKQAPLARNVSSDYATVLGAATATFQVNASGDDVNEVNKKLENSFQTIWLGNGGTTTTSFTAVRFNNVAIPKGSVITSAHIAVQPNSTQWIGMKFQIAGDNVGNSTPFSALSLPSGRVLTTAKVVHNSDVKWTGNNWYTFDELNKIIQEIVNRSDWKSGNSLSIVMKGTGGSYGRKIIKSFEAGTTTAPKLLVQYTTNDTIPTTAPTVANTPTSVPPTTVPTTRPTNTPTTIPPTATKAPTATVVPVTTTALITLAEDPSFTINVQTISPVTINPTFANYTFSSSTPGDKLLFAKFKSSTGQEQIFSSSITLTQITQNPSPTGTSGTQESMSMMAWRVGGKNAPNPLYDKCDDGTDVVAAHNQYFVIAYDGIKYPTWHPAVVVNPITGVGKCYFGHEHGTNPQGYMHWDEMVQHFGKDNDGDGKITGLVIASDGKITPGDRAGIPFGIANEHMDKYYNQEGRDSIFVRHEDHVGHKIEIVNNEAETQGNSTHTMAQLAGTNGINVPYYKSGSNTYQPTGVVCTHLHKFHQGTNSADAVRNNLHEVIFHSTCTSVDTNGINAPAYYPSNTVLLTGMMAFGNPGGFKRFCFSDRSTLVCPDGKNANGSCVVTDPLISKLPNAVNSTSLGRNMVDKYCLDNFASLNPGTNYFNPYELWEGDLRIQTPTGKLIAEHGRQWDVLDPVRYVDPNAASGVGYLQDRCNQGLPYSGNCDRGVKGALWDSPKAAFKGLQRTAYFGRNRISNSGGSQIWYTDPLGSNATTTEFPSGLKQRVSSVEADIQKVQSRVQQLFGGDNFLNDRALQRYFDSGGGSVHAPN